ncbi:PREDICTED: putative acyl-activating enzyme 19 [Erythranthe guttata]|uniref:putative acyl-activating enzyme 19 n=1 Tax=Erythranthe guttata TaxID=4155 RepID=UPI00064DF18B|nr:PREDICTED: putative acyl-activating enzyme 19 [Erythranthe guttata]|eukprot:XP_012852882.1 PREDICTED: putative acyl-activating enzyme 19 [Erythranthe guttata]
MAAGETAERKPSACCISHAFYKAASKFPHKIAVIHASGFARITRDNTAANAPPHDDAIELASVERASSSRPPVYDGDDCFTFSDIISAVDNLSSRLRHILNGADDPYPINAQPVNSFREESAQVSEESLQCFSTNFRNLRTPKVVGIYMEPSVEYIVAVLSVLRCGEAFMPLDPSWPKARILSLLSSSKANLVIGVESSNEEKLFHRLDTIGWLVSEGNRPVLCVCMNDIIKEQSRPLVLEWPCENERLRSFCYLMYTSGSSGKPKGVCGTEIGAIFLLRLRGSVLSTCTLVIPPFNQLKENIFYITEFLQGYLINRLVAVPSLIRAILPSLQSRRFRRIQYSLKLLVLSGEVLHLSLCKTLLKLLPQTSVLNLYGSTEVTGDCTYFDCKRLPLILEKEELSSVPVGLPLSNCEVVLVGEDAPLQGEIYVSGLCVAAGYFDYPYLIPLADRVQKYFKTGDFARKLSSGDFVIIGRKDRTLKVNGQRVALEEIETAFRDHPSVVDAAVLSREVDGEILLLEAHVVMEEKNEDDELLESSLRNWLLNMLPQVMIPTRILLTRSLPLTSSGKVDYMSLAASTTSDEQDRINVKEMNQDNLIQVILKVFSDALMVEKVSVDDDFFEMGGNSISAAYATFKLGIHMKLLYTFPTPRRLQTALLSSKFSVQIDAHSGVDSNMDNYNPIKKLKVESKEQSPRDILWNPGAVVHTECTFSRCNRSTHGVQCEENYSSNAASSKIRPRDGKGFMQVQWKVDMESCVDASPLVVFKGSRVCVFIGSHSRKFVCIDGKSGVVQWETKLEGRVECSAAILDDFSQVIVGCYKGKIYFLNFSNGSVSWSFQTNGEVKSQPVIDKRRHLVWCGSYDHNLYAIDYRNYCCIYKLPCGGSIFGSPAINEMQENLYVASTSGHITALEIKTMPFKKLWKQDIGAPVFGSLSINYPNGNVICCLVDGSVVVLNPSGSVVWKVKTGGPIFAGPCASRALPSEVLVCSRDGSIYSFETETSNLIWKHSIGSPITSSPYVDDNSPISDRLICVCDSSGSIYVLRVDSNAIGDSEQNTENTVREFARLDLQGDIFSSPVMIGGRIFVGCRDNHVYCIALGLE